MRTNKVKIKCSLETLTRLEEQKRLSFKIFSRNEIIVFRSYVLALCHELKPTGNIYRLRNKISVPRVNEIYKSSNVYRLASIISESTRLIAHNYEKIATWSVEDCPCKYHHPSWMACLLLAYKMKRYFPREFDRVNCWKFIRQPQLIMPLLLILDRYWNSSQIESTLINLPLTSSPENKHNALCVYYDNTNLLQMIIVLIILKFLFTAYMQVRSY